MVLGLNTVHNYIDRVYYLPVQNCVPARANEITKLIRTRGTRNHCYFA